MKKVTRLLTVNEILSTYDGKNPYIQYLSSLYKSNALNQITDFQLDYIEKNKHSVPKFINRVVKISDWVGERIQKEYNLEYLPQKVLIESVVGENEHSYHVYLKYSQTQKYATSFFLSKKGLLDELFYIDYEKTEIDFDKYDEKLIPLGFNLYDHQKTAIKFLNTKKKCILADDQGLGKTISTIVAAIEGGFNKVLILCPASLKTNWASELELFVDKNDISIINSDKEYKDAKYTIINYDIIDKYYKIPYEDYITQVKQKDGTYKNVTKQKKSRKKEVILECLNNSLLYQSKFELVIMDECHKLSNNSSGRYKTIEDFINRSKIENIYGLSGTPITNKPINYYNILNLVGAEISKDWEFFVKRYCDGKKIRRKDTGKEIWITDGSSNLDELYEKTKSIYLRREKSDIPGLPPKFMYKYMYKFTEEQHNIYKNLWDEYVKENSLKIENECDIAEHIISLEENKKLIECGILRQYAANIMIEKTINLTDKCLERGEKVVIACCYDEEINQLKEYYKDKAVIYKGGMSIKQKDAAKLKFMKDNDIVVFIGNINAAGVGITLTSSRVCIFNSFSWVPGDNLQMMDRVHRIGQKRDVQILFQTFDDSIYEHMWDTVMSKSNIITNVIKDEKNKGSIE